MQEIDLIDLLPGILNLAAAMTRLVANFLDRRSREPKATD
jgi:hypothetical protein